MEAYAKVCPRCGSKFDAAAVFCQKDGAALRLLEEDRDPRIGQVLLDQFRIEERIGAGGMGMVYRARQTTLGRDVAIKILHPDLAQNPDAVRRFHREARISTSLDHPNIVRVFLFGQLPDGSLYLVMELLRGRPLADLLRIEPRLPIGRALHIAIQVCEGVGEAHTQGIVHRDVKPENIFLTPKGRDPDFVKVLDFGIARLLRADDQTSATQSGLVFGTARYISPEGAAGEATDARSDVYSIGVLVYQMLVGETPFDGSSPVTLLMQHIHERVPHLKTKGGGAYVPDGVADVVMRALSKNPEGRYEDGAHFAEVLRDAAERAGIAFRPRRDPSGQVSVTASVGHASSSLAHGAAGHGGAGLGQAPPSAHTEDLVVAGLARPRRDDVRGGMAALAIAAFLLGIVGVGGAFWAYQSFSEPTTEEVHAERIASAEAALAAGRIDGDGADTVRAWTDLILASRAGDPEALRVRRAGGEALARQGLEAEQAGHREEALALHRRALALVPELEVSRARVEELERPVGPTEASLTVSPAPIAGEPVQFQVVLPSDQVPPSSARPRFVVRRDGRRIGRPLDALPGTSAASWVASYTFALPGRYEVMFQSSDGPEAVHVTAEAEVARNPRTSSGGGDPPVTTQGALGPTAPVQLPGTPAPFVATPVGAMAQQVTQQVAPYAQQVVEQAQRLAAPEPALQPISPSTPVNTTTPSLPPAWSSGN